MLDIRGLRTLVDEGWTIANRRGLSKLIGEEECKKLGQAYKKLNDNRYADYNVPSLAETGCDMWIPTGGIALIKKDGTYAMRMPVNVGKYFMENNKLIFIGRNINLDVITQRLKEWEKKVVELVNKSRNLPKSAIEESSTMRKLYSPEFKVTQSINEDGYYLTSLIDKKTGKPAICYVKQLCMKEDGYEYWCICIKNSKGEYEKIAYRDFKIDRATSTVKPGNMNSTNGSDLYGGIGLRLHQIAIERMLQENLKGIEICSTGSAFPFHYKSGFRTVDMNINISENKLNQYIDKWVHDSDLTKDELESAIIGIKDGKGNILLNSKTLENWKKMQFLRNRYKVVLGDIPMTLSGEQLDKWKQMISEQPIIIKDSPQ